MLKINVPSWKKCTGTIQHWRMMFQQQLHSNNMIYTYQIWIKAVHVISLAELVKKHETYKVRDLFSVKTPHSQFTSKFKNGRSTGVNSFTRYQATGYHNLWRSHFGEGHNNKLTQSQIRKWEWACIKCIW